MLNDGFTVVKNKKKFSRRKNYELNQIVRLEGSVKEIEDALTKAEKEIEDSGLSLWVLTNIRSLIGNRQVTQVYVIGNGHFDAPWEPGTHQFALIRKICHEFNSEMIFQEPCISNIERQWLSKQKKIFCRDSIDVNVKFEDGDSHNVIIVVLIHGLHDILNDFLSLNWPLKLRNIILICNDYRNIDRLDLENCSKYYFLNNFRKYATFLAFPDYIPNPTFFFSSSLAYVKQSIPLENLDLSL